MLCHAEMNPLYYGGESLYFYKMIWWSEQYFMSSFQESSYGETKYISQCINT